MSPTSTGRSTWLEQSTASRWNAAPSRTPSTSTLTKTSPGSSITLSSPQASGSISWCTPNAGSRTCISSSRVWRLAARSVRAPGHQLSQHREPETDLVLQPGPERAPEDLAQPLDRVRRDGRHLHPDIGRAVHLLRRHQESVEPPAGGFMADHAPTGPRKQPDPTERPRT